VSGQNVDPPEVDRRDARLGFIVLLGILAIAGWSSQADRDIRAPIRLQGMIEEPLGEAVDAGLPLGDWPCSHQLRGESLHCSETVRLRMDLPLDVGIRPLLELDGEIRSGGSRAPDQGILVYASGEGHRFTTSWKTAKKVAKRSGEAELFFGHELP